MGAHDVTLELVRHRHPRHVGAGYPRGAGRQASRVALRPASRPRGVGMATAPRSLRSRPRGSPIPPRSRVERAGAQIVGEPADHLDVGEIGGRGRIQHHLAVDAGVPPLILVLHVAASDQRTTTAHSVLRRPNCTCSVTSNSAARRLSLLMPTARPFTTRTARSRRHRCEARRRRPRHSQGRSPSCDRRRWDSRRARTAAADGTASARSCRWGGQSPRSPRSRPRGFGHRRLARNRGWLIVQQPGAATTRPRRIIEARLLESFWNARRRIGEREAPRAVQPPEPRWRRAPAPPRLRHLARATAASASAGGHTRCALGLPTVASPELETR